MAALRAFTEVGRISDLAHHLCGAVGGLRDGCMRSPTAICGNRLGGESQWLTSTTRMACRRTKLEPVPSMPNASTAEGARPRHELHVPRSADALGESGAKGIDVFMRVDADDNGARQLDDPCDMRQTSLPQAGDMVCRADRTVSLRPGPYWVTAHPIKPHLGECCPTQADRSMQGHEVTHTQGSNLLGQHHHAHSQTN